MKQMPKVRGYVVAHNDHEMTDLIASRVSAETRKVEWSHWFSNLRVKEMIW